jgi:hypothetical protein
MSVTPPCGCAPICRSRTLGAPTPAATANGSWSATIGERSVGDQGRFGEFLGGRDVECSFKSACYLSGARVVCMTLDNRKGHGKPSTTRLRHAARAEGPSSRPRRSAPKACLPSHGGPIDPGQSFT